MTGVTFRITRRRLRLTVLTIFRTGGADLANALAIVILFVCYTLLYNPYRVSIGSGRLAAAHRARADRTCAAEGDDSVIIIVVLLSRRLPMPFENGHGDLAPRSGPPAESLRLGARNAFRSGPPFSRNTTCFMFLVKFYGAPRSTGGRLFDVRPVHAAGPSPFVGNEFVSQFLWVIARLKSRVRSRRNSNNNDVYRRRVTAVSFASPVPLVSSPVTDRRVRQPKT